MGILNYSSKLLGAFMLLSTLLFSSCAGFLGIADDIEKIANNDAIIIKVDKDALKEDTNVYVDVAVINRQVKPSQTTK